MTAKRYLLIDAYNVIHANANLRRALGRSLDVARDLLAEKVLAIHNVEGIHTILVLDSRHESLEVEHPFGQQSFELVYAPARLSADGVIEQLLNRVTETAHVTVASNDGMVRECARANGAIAIGCADLLDWACACERRFAQDAQQRKRKNELEWKNGIELDW